MREIKVSEVTDVIAKLCMDSCYYLPQEMMDKIRNAAVEEESPLGREILATLIENFELAKKKAVPLCQDTGLTVVFLEIGQEVHFVDGDLYTAIHAGVAKGYTEGYLRKSSVGDPVFDRKNSGDNTPAIIHTKIVPGEKVKIIVCPKGCGSENMGALKMLKPADGVEGIKNLLLIPCVRQARTLARRLRRRRHRRQHGARRYFGKIRADPYRRRTQ